MQILGDAHGNLVHLWERDCSVQRRHQKVVEIAPEHQPRRRSSAQRHLRRGRARCARAVGYRNAGTVEFLLDVDRDEFFFIEVNPRIQVEHTVTEVVTGIDIVKSQILIAQGHKLHEPPLNIPTQEQDRAPRRTRSSAASPPKIPRTTSSPTTAASRPIARAGGFGVRLDGGNGFGGAVITPYFDSLLVKVTTWGATLEEAIARMDRALREFRIRGVKTNIPFLENLIDHPTFLSRRRDDDVHRQDAGAVPLPRRAATARPRS